MNSSDDRGMDVDSRIEVFSLASTVISVLSDKPANAGTPFRTSVLRRLLRDALRDSPFHGAALLDELVDGRVTRDQVVDLYIPEVARELGAMWSDDEISFARVTIATARLQGLLTLIAPPWQASHDAEERAVLFVVVGSDGHTLGAHIAAAQLRRAGVTVRMVFAASEAEIAGRLQDCRYDMVMVSVSYADGLELAGKIIRTIRVGLPGTPPIALGGLVLGLAERVKEHTGADLVTNDIRVALRLCDTNRISARLRQAARR